MRMHFILHIFLITALSTSAILVSACDPDNKQAQPDRGDRQGPIDVPAPVVPDHIPTPSDFEREQAPEERSHEPLPWPAEICI